MPGKCNESTAWFEIKFFFFFRPIWQVKKSGEKTFLKTFLQFEKKKFFFAHGQKWKMKNEKQKNKNFFGSEKILAKKVFFFKISSNRRVFRGWKWKMKKIKTKTFFWSIILDFFQPEFQNEKIKFFLLSAKNEKWKMKNKKLYFEKSFFKIFLLFLGHFE